MDLFELNGRVVVNLADAVKAFNEIQKEGKQTESKMSKFFKGIGKGAVAIGKTVATGMVAGGTAVAGLATKAVQAYADYEQLVGGVETLFKGSAEKVKKYADNAYKTAGLSANAYMETVTSFSASLLQSLDGDTEKAAEKADQAITDMSDNANKMGSSMEMIQNAYQGFAKQNYTMLDNLKLGYGGTKEEMERLLKDAEKISGQKFDISSYADVVDAIHVVQTEMGITGTTAKEAEKTISGSIGMMKASWTNLLTGLANGNADIPKLVRDVVNSGKTVLKNIIPAVKEVLKNIPAAISEISPEAGAAFQKIIDIVTAALPVIKDVVTTTFDVIKNVFTFISEHTGLIIGVATAIGVVVTAIGAYNAVQAIKAAMDAANVTTVWALVSAHIAQAAAAMAAVAPYVLIVAAIAAVIAIIVLCIKHWDKIVEAVKNCVKKMTDSWKSFMNWLDSKVIQPMLNWFKNLWKGITSVFANVGSWFSEKFQTAKNGVINAWNSVKSWFSNLWNGIKNVFSSVGSWFRNIFSSAKNGVQNAWSGVKGFFSNIKSGIVNAFSNVKEKLTAPFTKARDAIKGVVDKIKGFFSGMNISIPKIKLPHLKISGKLSLSPPSVPKLSVDWYAKAMNNPMILNDPTIFGYNPTTGNFMGGGEVPGGEVVSGASTLMNMIGQAVESKTAEQTERIIAVLTAILNAMLSGNREMLQALLADKTFKVGERDFARLVREYA